MKFPLKIRARLYTNEMCHAEVEWLKAQHKGQKSTNEWNEHRDLIGRLAERQFGIVYDEMMPVLDKPGGDNGDFFRKDGTILDQKGTESKPEMIAGERHHEDWLYCKAMVNRHKMTAELLGWAWGWEISQGVPEERNGKPVRVLYKYHPMETLIWPMDNVCACGHKDYEHRKRIQCLQCSCLRFVA